jgi:hypothetical protein
VSVSFSPNATFSRTKLTKLSALRKNLRRTRRCWAIALQREFGWASARVKRIRVKLRQERHRCRDRYPQNPSPIGAASWWAGRTMAPPEHAGAPTARRHTSLGQRHRVKPVRNPGGLKARSDTHDGNLYPNGIPSLSPALRRRSYDGNRPRQAGGLPDGSRGSQHCEDPRTPMRVESASRRDAGKLRCSGRVEESSGSRASGTPSGVPPLLRLGPGGLRGAPTSGYRLPSLRDGPIRPFGMSKLQHWAVGPGWHGAGPLALRTVGDFRRRTKAAQTCQTPATTIPCRREQA